MVEFTMIHPWITLVLCVLAAVLMTVALLVLMEE